MEERPESYLELELRHAKERAEAVERIREEAYLAGLHDRAKPGSIAGATSIIEQITERVALAYRVHHSELRGPSRIRAFNEPRARVWMEARERGYSLTRIGKYFNRDHTTIMHGIKRQERIDKKERDNGPLSDGNASHSGGQ